MGQLVWIKNLSRKFGKTVAVDDLSLTIDEGTILGFVGPNGAGKTTTLKMLATVLRPTRGDALIAGHSLKKDRNSIRRLIGYMPDVCGLYEEMMVHEYLRFFASAYGIRHRPAEATIDNVLELTGLESKANALCGSLSRGMSQRLHLARVLLHDPRLLLLDEPAAGLDPRARVEFRNLVTTLRDLGKTMIISSHILFELGEMCDSIAIIEKGALVDHGPVDRLLGPSDGEGRVFEVSVQSEPIAGRSFGDLVEMVQTFEYVDAVRESEREQTLLVRFAPEFEEFFRLNDELVRRGFRVEHFAEERMPLEAAFLRLTKGLVQ